MSRRLTYSACLPVMPTVKKAHSSRSLNGERRNSRPFNFNRPTRSAIRESVFFHTVGFHPEPPHDPFQHDQVLPDIRGDPPQVVTSGVASTADATRWATLAPATPAAW